MRNPTEIKSKTERVLLFRQINNLLYKFERLDSEAMYALLKEKGVSDSEISRSLGVSRQAVFNKYAQGYKLAKVNDS